MKDSKIEWCTDTWNPWFGCTEVSEACAHCYARTSSPANALRAKGHETWGKGSARQRTSASYWKLPLQWNKAAQLLQQRPRVFSASLADWLDPEVPIEWLVDFLDILRLTPHLDWLLLTKRPQLFKKRMNAALKLILKATGGQPCNVADFIDGWVNKLDSIPPHVWIGTTVENQDRANERIPHLLDIPARLRFLSCEPLLGPVSFAAMPLDPDDSWFRYWPLTGASLRDGMNEPAVFDGAQRIHWVIAGGESGPKARAMHPDWARSLRDQCTAAGVPFLFKQWGEWLPACQYQEGDKERLREKAQHSFDHDVHSWWVGKRNSGRQLDGQIWHQFPAPFLRASARPLLP